MMSTLSWANSAAISAKRSLRPSAQRYSIAIVRPSIQPRSWSRRTNAATRSLSPTGVLSPKNPTIGRFPGCCACAASGQAAAPPSSVMNSRRFIDRIASAAPARGPGSITDWRGSSQGSLHCGIATSLCRLGVVCHEDRRSKRRCVTVREMKEGPSRPAVRFWPQTAASCCRQKRWW